jgi:heterodisulfide reductase subunit A
MSRAREEKNQAVLVVGAGIAGMAAGMHLAEGGTPVYLLEAGPAIGGSMHLLDHTFPTNSCGLCLMLPQQPAYCPTFECEQKGNMRLLPYAELVGLEGEPGEFRATVRHKARYVDAARCNSCGECAAACPEARPHDHEGWVQPVKAIYRPAGLRAVPDTWVIDMGYCTRCGACVQACPRGAIDLAMQPREETLEVGAVLLTPGFAPFDAKLKGEYGYGVYDNVLSSLEFERMVSLAGSSVAHLHRPSAGATGTITLAGTGGQKPRRIAFIQCVGSRDNLCGAGHCSSACCMYTAKQVALAKKIDPALEATVFYMDLRAFGKDFESYLEGVQALPGVRYLRAMPSRVHEMQQTKALRLSYVAGDGGLQEEEFDLVVLALGFAPPEGMQGLARELGVALNGYGFAVTDGYHPTRTNREGIFVAGAFREPKDIPETVAEAAGAAAEVAVFLQPTDSQPTDSQSTNSQLRDVADEEPRIGVFVCECQDGEMAGLDLPEVAGWAAGLPGVASARTMGRGCSAEGQAAMAAAIAGEKLNRVVVAGCTHRLYRDEFESVMRSAGLDPRLLSRVNLREQGVYPHRGNGHGEAVKHKARSLVGMAVAGLKAMAGVEALSLGAAAQERVRRAVVVGGGAAGLAASLSLAGQGIAVELVEREAELGGQWRQLHYQVGSESGEPQAALQEWLDRVAGEERIRVHLNSELVSIEGGPGHYRSSLVTDGQRAAVEHGVLVVATGGRPAETAEYLHGQDPRVMTQRELERQIAEGTLATVKTVVMIQCVGSREPGRAYCSRVCCTQAVKNALKLKELRPEVNVYVLYREMRTYGYREAFYQAARDAGVVFVRYELPAKPQVRARSDRLQVEVTEPVTGQELELDADLLVLSVGIEAAKQGTLAGILGVGLNGDGFFQEEHPKMKPLDLGRGGMYVAGLAHSPRFLEETIVQGQGAAMRVAAWLAEPTGTPEGVQEQPTSVWVNPRLCSFCGLCVEACPFEARVLNYETRVADVDYALCRGCGVCAVVCPNKATLQKTFEHGQLLAAIDMALA